MMVGTLAVLDAYYPGGLFTLFAKGSAPNAADETYARTMAFTTLMMFQLFNVYNCCLSWRSAFSGFGQQMVACGGAVVARHSRTSDLRAVSAGGLHRCIDADGLGGDDLVAAVLLVGMEIVKLSLRAKPHYARRIGRAAPAE